MSQKRRNCTIAEMDKTERQRAEQIADPSETEEV